MKCGLYAAAAVAAALTIAPAVWAQSPTGGNSVGLPGPNPGGPGLTPYTGGGAGSATTPAALPAHHAVRHARAMHAHHMHMARKAALTGDTTAQLNREELARIQLGNTSNPSAPAAPPQSAPPPSGDMGGPRTSGSSGAGPR
jgi:hypothetical protein